jgi:hypothetical protein
MFDSSEYHQSIRKLVVAFGTMFNNVRISVEGNVIVIPLSYSPRQRFMTKVRQAQSGNAEIGLTLPRMAFELSNISYDAQRKLNSLTPMWISHDTGIETAQIQYQRVPYNIDISLYAIVRETEEGLQLVESILPYFTPELNISINDVVKHDIPLTLNSTSFQDDYEGTLAGTQARAITWSFDFTAKTYLYYPARSAKYISGSLIDFKLIDEDNPHGLDGNPI